MKRLQRQRPFLQSFLNEADRYKRQDLLQHANADQINAFSELTLNLLKQHIPVSPATMAKLRWHKKSLREMSRRRLSVKRRREHLFKQKGSGFWSGLCDCSPATTMNTCDKNGHPLQGHDTVPARRRPLVNLTNLLQDANDRLFEEVQTWKAAHNHLQGEHAALKHAHLCSSCQLQRVTAEPGQTLELTYTAGQRLPDKVQTLKRDLDTKTREAAYWQACYETLLGESYGRGDDGAHQGLR